MSTFSSAELWGVILTFFITAVVLVVLFRLFLPRLTLRARLTKFSEKHNNSPKQDRLYTGASLFNEPEPLTEEQPRGQHGDGQWQQNSNIRYYDEIMRERVEVKRKFYESSIFLSFVEILFLAYSENYFFTQLLEILASHEHADQAFYLSHVTQEKAHEALKVEYIFSASKDTHKLKADLGRVPPFFAKTKMYLKRMEPFVIHERRALEHIFSLFLPLGTIEKSLLPAHRLEKIQELWPAVQFMGCFKFERITSGEGENADLMLFKKQRSFYTNVILLLAKFHALVHAFQGERTDNAMGNVLTETYMETLVKFLVQETAEVFSKKQGGEGEEKKDSVLFFLVALDFFTDDALRPQLIATLGKWNDFLRKRWEGKNIYVPAVSRERRTRFYLLTFTKAGKNLFKTKLATWVDAFLDEEKIRKADVRFEVGFYDLLERPLTSFATLKAEA